MVKVVHKDRNNFISNVINENGVQMTIRVHTFRGMGYMSVFADGVLIFGSAPCIGGTEVGSRSMKNMYGTFFWNGKYGNSEYPFVDNYGIAYELYYKQPSECRRDSMNGQ